MRYSIFRMNGKPSLFLRILSAFCAPIFVFLLLLPGRFAGGQAVSRQRRINEAAASLERARRAILETPRLRRGKEDLSAYFGKIFSPGAGRPVLMKDWKPFAAALERAAHETVGYRKLPPLLDTSSQNRKWWEGAVSALGRLPQKIQEIKAAGQKKPDASGGNEALAKAFASTLLVLIEARDGLRNARP